MVMNILQYTYYHHRHEFEHHGHVIPLSQESTIVNGALDLCLPLWLLNAIIIAPLLNVYASIPALLFGKDVGIGAVHDNPSSLLST